MGLRRIAAIGLVAFGLSLFLAGPAPAQSSVSYTISPLQGPAGTIVSFNGTGCPQETDPNVTRAEVRFEVFAAIGAGVSQGSFIAFGGAQSNPDGSFSGTTTISANAEVGVHQTQIVCTGGRLQGALFTVTALQNSTTTSSSTTTTAAPPASSTSTTVIPDTVPDVTTTTVAAQPTATTAPSATSTVPSTTSTTLLLSVSQTTSVTPSVSLALTGFDPTDFVLWAMSIILFGLACWFATYCPWFPQVEDRIRQFGRALADLFAPTPLQ